MSREIRYSRYIEYIKNAGGTPKTAWFDDDFEPIGPKIRSQMLEEDVTRECDGKVFLMTENMI